MKRISLILITVTFTSFAFAQSVIIKDTDTNSLIEINDEGTTGSITLPSGGTPGSLKNKLYNDGGALKWSGSTLATGSSLWTLGASDVIYYNSGKVGIGTTSPFTKFEVEWEPLTNTINPIAVFESEGPTNSSAAIRVQNTSGNKYHFGMIHPPDNGFALAYNDNIGQLSDLIRITTDGKVGIGTVNPVYPLDVNGTAQMTGFKLPTGASNGHVLTSDANGVGTWQASAGVADGDWTISGSDMYSTVSGNVGIGTADPLSRFSVGGDGYYNTVIYGKVSTSDDHGIYIENATSAAGIYSESNSAGYSGYFDGPFYVGGNIGLGTTDFGGGDGILVLHNALTNPTTALSSSAALYSSGGELWAYDAAGHTTQISPHDKETGEWIFYSKNTQTGRVVKINMEKLVKTVEELTGESFMDEWVEK